MSEATQKREAQGRRHLQCPLGVQTQTSEDVQSHFGSSLNNGHKADIAGGPSRATRRHRACAFKKTREVTS